MVKRLPLHVIAKLRSLKYWLRISGSNNSLVLDAFKSQITNTLPINYKCWTGKVKLSLDYLGFSDYWYQEQLNVKLYPIFFERVKDQYIQSWKAEINMCRKLEYYCKYKEE